MAGFWCECSNLLYPATSRHVTELNGEILLGGAIVASISGFATYNKHATVNHVSQFT